MYAAAFIPVKSLFIFPLTSAGSFLMNNESFSSEVILVPLITSMTHCQLLLRSFTKLNQTILSPVRHGVSITTICGPAFPCIL